MANITGQGVDQYGLNEVGDVHSLIVSEIPAHLALQAQRGGVTAP